MIMFFGVPFAVACTASGGNSETDSNASNLRRKFRGVQGVVLRIDAETPKHGVMIVSDTGVRIDSPAQLNLSKVDNLTYTDNLLSVPVSIHVTWRDGDYKYAGQGVWTEGRVVGDYTVPIAERIPAGVLDYIRRNGGALRLKIRLKDDGVLIGWDVEKIVPYNEWKPGIGLHTGVNYLMPGGDFREAQVYNGKVTDPGWEKQ